MIITIPYGKKQISAKIPEPCKILLPKPGDQVDEHQRISDALKHPVDMCSFSDFIDQSSKLLILVNDASRPTPTSKILDIISQKLLTCSEVIFLIATGTHSPPTKEELAQIFGKHYQIFKDNIIIHDAKNTSQLTKIGTTSRGTIVSVNTLVLEYTNILVIGSVEPHYFAGYTGGRKSFLPGVSAYETIEMNHKHAVHDQADSLILNGNPVHEDMMEAVSLLKNKHIFSIQSVLSYDHHIHRVIAGDITTSFEQAIPFTKQLYHIPIKQKANIVISAASYPLDRDLYQSQKAIENAKHALEKHGVLILVSQCREGLGSRTYFDILCANQTIDDMKHSCHAEYKLGYHKALKIKELSSWANLWAVTDLEDDQIQNAQFIPYHDLQQAIDAALLLIKKQGKKPRTLILPQGSITIPRIT